MIILAVLIAVAIWGKTEYDAYNYGVDLHNAVYYAMQSASHLENAGVQFINVWNNSYYKVKDEETDRFTREADGTGQFYSDFNEALALVISDSTYTTEIKQAEDTRREAYGCMGRLTNPPKRFEEAYRDVKAFYSNYMSFYNVVSNPNGTLEEYSEKYTEMRDILPKSYYSVSMY